MKSLLESILLKFCTLALHWFMQFLGLISPGGGWESKNILLSLFAQFLYTRSALIHAVLGSITSGAWWKIKNIFLNFFTQSLHKAHCRWKCIKLWIKRFFFYFLFNYKESSSNHLFKYPRFRVFFIYVLDYLFNIFIAINKKFLILHYVK